MATCIFVLILILVYPLAKLLVYFQDKNIEALRIKADFSASALFSNATPLADQYLEQGYAFLKTEDGAKIRFPPLTTEEIEIEKALQVKRDSEYVNLDKFFPPLKIHNHFITQSSRGANVVSDRV